MGCYCQVCGCKTYDLFAALCKCEDNALKGTVEEIAKQATSWKETRTFDSSKIHILGHKLEHDLYESLFEEFERDSVYDMAREVLNFIRLEFVDIHPGDTSFYSNVCKGCAKKNSPNHCPQCNGKITDWEIKE